MTFSIYRHFSIKQAVLLPSFSNMHHSNSLSLFFFLFPHRRNLSGFWNIKYRLMCTALAQTFLHEKIYSKFLSAIYPFLSGGFWVLQQVNSCRNPIFPNPSIYCPVYPRCRKGINQKHYQSLNLRHWDNDSRATHGTKSPLWRPWFACHPACSWRQLQSEGGLRTTEQGNNLNTSSPWDTCFQICDCLGVNVQQRARWQRKSALSDTFRREVSDQ